MSVFNQKKTFFRYICTIIISKVLFLNLISVLYISYDYFIIFKYHFEYYKKNNIIFFMKKK